MNTIGEIVRHRAQTQPDRPAFTVLSADEPTETALTYADIDRSARAVAVALDQPPAAGARVLLALPQSAGYLRALFGCMLAGATAVPCYPPQSRRRSRLLATLVADADAEVVITDRASEERVATDLAGDDRSSGLRILMIDDIPDDLGDNYRADPSGTPIALLQYTSGSTGAPKGVIVTHDNLIANGHAVREGFGWGPDTRMVSWCPLFHDMGIFAGAISPMIIGFHSVLLRPEDFIMRPRRWLEAITRYQGTAGGGPDFGFELCTTRITGDQLDGIDLSSWVAAFNGAEPVRAGTLERFSAAFADCGFRPAAFFPCYGMAEATSFISGGRDSSTPAVGVFDAEALSQGDVVTVAAGHRAARKLVSCGRVSTGHEAFAVDPVLRQRLPEHRVGELWFTGPSVANGYWRSPVASDETFAGTLAGGDGPYLRTGDLGFVRDREIYIVGRIKDIIIIRGRNYSPSDLELTVRHSHPDLRRTDGVVFAVDSDGEDRLVIAWEVRVRRATFDPRPVLDAIRAAIAAEHGVEVYAIALLRPGGVPKTTSGKVQRAACRARFIAQALEPVAAWGTSASDVEDGPITGDQPLNPAAGSRAGLEAEVEGWLVDQLARSLGLPAPGVDVHRPLADFGLDSVQGMRLAADLSVLLGRQLPATLVWEHPTIAKLARYLAERQEVPR